MVHGINFIGSVPVWLLVFGLVIIGWKTRGGSADKAIDILRDSNEVLTKRLDQVEKQDKEKDATIAALQAKTDITVALIPLLTWTETHEKNAAERHIAMLRILDLIASRLGPEPNGNAH